MKSSVASTPRPAERLIRWEKAKKRLTIISLVLLLCAFVAKEILLPSLKSRCEALASAETTYENEVDRSGIALQFVTLQQQIETDKIEALKASKETQRDYSSLIFQSTSMAQQVKMDLDSTFGDVSDLIDALPAGQRDLRQVRDKMRSGIQVVETQIGITLKPTPQRGAARLVQVELAMSMLAVQEIPVLVLGDMTLTTMRRIRQSDETLLRWSTGAFWLFGLLNFSLAIFGAVAGIKLSE